MSFLQSQLQQNKMKLRPTETVVTQRDGQRFIESNYCNSRKLVLDQSSPGYVVDTKPDDIPAKVIDHLYLGSQDCCDLNVLAKYNIRHVLSLGVESPVKSSGVRYKFIEMLDLEETKLQDHLPVCLDFIDRSIDCGENVLVHCNAGVSRASTIVISYLILRKHFDFQEAFDLTKIARHCIRPNDGFMAQLRQLKSV